MRKSRIFLSMLALIGAGFLVASCFSEAKKFGEPIRQYADFVIAYSSQWTPTNWSASRALGPENVYPDYGTNVNAWASLTADGQREFLVLGFDTTQLVTLIEIFETRSPGAIDTVYLRSRGRWVEVYTGTAEEPDVPDEARIFTVPVSPPVYEVDAIRIAINSPAIAGWNEIDAVAITGRFTVPQDE